MKVAITYNLRTKNNEDQAEFDEWPVVRDIARVIRTQGHEVRTIDVGDLHWIEQLEGMRPLQAKVRPDVVFNMAEGTKGPSRESIVPAVLEELSIPYTGSDAATMALTLNKFQAKLVAKSLGVSTAKAIFCTTNGMNGVGYDLKGDLPAYPIIVKPNFEGSSKGITASSVATNEKQLRILNEKMLKKYPDGVLNEMFLPGFDASVVCLSMGGWKFFPVWYETLKHNNRHNIRTLDLKNKHAEHVKVHRFREINGIARLMIDMSGYLVRIFNIKDIARFDFRISDETPYFLEANPLPTLGKGSSVFLTSRNSGYTATRVIAQMLSNAIQRKHGLQ